MDPGQLDRGPFAMIDRAEILRVANTLGLEARVVEKDYVLGWVLHGIARDPLLGESWVFKGGTCLKKCYFETYRFSEDLDFTVTEPAHLNEAILLERFRMIGAQLYDETGIELPAELLRFNIWTTKTGKRAGEGRLSYRGPIAPRGGDLPRIKIDLTADEILALPSVMRPAGHAYSDVPAEGMAVRCYVFEEVFGEKVRALGQRARPRDLYDVINLFRNGEFHPAAPVIRDVLRQKCAFKSIDIPTFESLAGFREELVGEWDNMLAHQLPSLPPVEAFWDALPEFFSWLAGTRPAAVLAAYPLDAGEEVIHAPAGAIRINGRSMPAIEVIRFAGANRLCVDLDYVDEQGRRGTRTIEPYSLRRTQAGAIVLHAVRADAQQHRSYRIDRIQGASVTIQTFVPRYAIELTPTGPLVAPMTESRAGPAMPVARRIRSSAYALVHVFRCPVCNKRFERKAYDATLRPHKAPQGWTCSGRHGIYEGRK
jgi:predicted nucleotidyltransferase component of viral defense system